MRTQLETLIEQDDWIDLDLYFQYAHRRYGYFLLPSWYGDYESLEMAVRQAALRTEAQTGAAAFAGLYWWDMQNDFDALIYANPDYLVQGIRDWVALRKAVPIFVAGLIQILHAVVYEFEPDDESVFATGRYDGMCKHLSTVLEEIVDHHLTAIVPEDWFNGVHGALAIVRRVKKKNWANGAKFSIGPKGLTVIAQPDEG